MHNISDTQRQQIEKCLSLALHPTSRDEEIISGIRGAHRLCRKHIGVGADDFIRTQMHSVSNDMDEPVNGMGSIGLTSRELIEQAALRTENERLRSENDRLRQQVESTQNELSDVYEKIDALQKENVLLMRHATSAPASKPIPVGGSYTFEEFSSALYAKLGTTKRALTVFSELTGTNFSRIQKWRRDEVVPIDAYEMVENLDLSKAVMKMRQPLLAEHREMIDNMSLQGLSDAKIADEMAKNFPDRAFNVNIIAGAKTQIRTAFLTSLKASGKSRDEATIEFIRRYPRARKPEQFIQTIYG